MKFTKEKALEILEKEGIYKMFMEVKYPEYPIKPKQPLIPKDKSSEAAFKYAEDLKIYESELELYKLKEKQRKRDWEEIRDFLGEIIAEESGLNRIPEQYKKKVWELAYMNGHSSGDYGVYQHLCELVEIFE